MRTGLFAAAALAVPLCAAEANLIPNPEFRARAGAEPEGWTFWAPRPSLAPEAGVAALPSGRALRLQSRAFGHYGKWISTAGGIRGGATYLFEILYRAEKIESEEVSVAAILSWNGGRELQRDYADRLSDAGGGWRRLSRILRAPEGAASVRVELLLRWANGGAVFWRQPRLAETEPVRHRLVRVATTRLRPPSPSTVAQNVKLMGDLIDRAAAEKPDLLLLSETLVDAGVKMPLPERAETIDGPAVRMLRDKARRHRTYIVTSLNLREGDLVYNTALLVDRRGEIAGRFRKVHLPLVEGEWGVTPGSDYPVFDTDFGRIGILVCWDNWFPEPARILRLKGAEMILLPIAGDGAPRHWDAISRARALDNGVYLVTSNTVGESGSRIIDPAGEVLAETTGASAVAAATLDLDKEWRLRWLSVGPGEGEARSLYIKERRPDTYGPLRTGAAPGVR